MLENKAIKQTCEDLEAFGVYVNLDEPTCREEWTEEPDKIRTLISLLCILLQNVIIEQDMIKYADELHNADELAQENARFCHQSGLLNK